MPRRSNRIQWERTDGRYRVAIFARKDHPSFRIEHGWCGDRPGSRSTTSKDLALSFAESQWKAYQDGLIERATVCVDTIGDMVEQIVKRAEKGSAKTARGYRAVWRLLVARVGAKREPKRVYPTDVKAFLSSYEGETHNTYLRTLRAGFRYAMSQGWIVDDPTAGISRKKGADLGPWFPFSEWDEFLHRCPPAHRIRAGFVLETGLRAGELAAARWDWIIGDVGIPAIRVAADTRSSFVPKWGRARAVPLTKEARRWLEFAAKLWNPGRDPSAFIFSSSGLAALGNLSKANRVACAGHGPRPRRGGHAARGERPALAPVDFHGLRRSAGAHWLDCGVPMLEVSRLLGHRSIMTTEKWYAGLSQSTLVASIRHVDDTRAELARSAKRSAKTSKG